MLVYINTSQKIEKNFYLFGITENSVPVYICIYEHETYFLCKTKIGREQINEISVEIEKYEIQSLLNDSGISLSRDIDVIYMGDAQNFKGLNKELPHYKIYLSDFNQLNSAKKKLSDEGHSMPEIPETQIKFFTDNGMKPSSWIEFDIPEKKGEKNQKGVIWDDFTETDSERKPYQFLMKSSSFKVYKEYKTPPGFQTITFDCETMSSKYGIDGSRAHSNALNSEDVIYCLSLVERNTSDPSVEDDICLFISDKNLSISNGKVINVCDEEELLMKMSEIIRKKDPDLILNYNGQGFDFPYMQKRSSDLSIPSFNRIKSFKYKKFNLNISLKIMDTQEYVSQSWEGAGGLFHSYTTAVAYGRIIADVFNLVKSTKVEKGIEGALQSLKLNDVGKYFVGETKNDISYAETYFGYRSKEIEALNRIASYCVQDSVLTWKVFHKINGHVYLTQAPGIFLVDANDVLVCGQNKKIYSNFLNRCLERNLSYYIYGGKTPNNGYEGASILKPRIGKFTNVITLDFASMYPSAQICKNICMTTFSKLRPDLPPDSYYEYDIPVETGDIEFPSNYYDLISFFDVEKISDPEYCRNFFETNEIKSEYRSSFLNAVREENDLEKITEKEIIKTFFVKPEIRKGVFPEMLEDLKKTRTEYKNMKKKAIAEGNQTMYEIFDQRQNLVKIVMNSIYGILGSKRGSLSCFEASATITYFGRQMIKKVKEFLEERGCLIIYGDTDSVMFQIPGYTEFHEDGTPRSFADKPDEKVIIYGKEISKEINAFLPKPMEVEFEKIMHMVPVKKKHYLGVKIYEDGKIIRSLFVKGLAGIRGDSTPFAQNLFKNVVSKIINDQKKDDITKYVDDEIKRLMDGEIPSEMLAVSSMLSHKYKSESAPMNVYSKYLKSVGEVAEAGTKIPYVVIKQDSSKKPKSFFFRPVDTNEPLDYEHYKNRAIRPIQEIIHAAFD